MTLHYPKLSDNNYGMWTMKMKIFMRAQGVWAVVVNKGGVYEKMDQMALAAVVQTTRGRSDDHLHARDSAKEVWDPLKELNMGEERI